MFDYCIPFLWVQGEAGDEAYWLEQLRLLASFYFLLSFKTMCWVALWRLHVQSVWRSWLTWGKICLPEWITHKQRQSQALWSSNTVDEVRKPQFYSWFFKWLTGGSALNFFPSQYFPIPLSKKIIIRKSSGIDRLPAQPMLEDFLLF